MLDGPDLSDVLPEPTGRAQVRAVVVHELGHLVGLAAVGAGPCVEDLATP